MKDASSIILTFINLLNIVGINIDLVEGIRGGQLAPDGEFTYQVAVFIRHHMACGGVVLRERHVLSGGQCVLDAAGYFMQENIEVLAGTNYLDSRAFGVQRKKVVYAYVKYEFRPVRRNRTLFPEYADFSILVLEDDLVLGPNTGVTKAFIPEGKKGRFPKYVFSRANLSGFGQTTSFQFQSASNLTDLGYRRNSMRRMYYITTYIQRMDIAQYTYPGFEDYHLPANSLPLGEYPAGACKGDIGSPLVLEGGFVIGILQIHSKDCHDREAPAVYTRVTTFAIFIKRIMDGYFDEDMRLGNYTSQHVHEIHHPNRENW